MPEAFVDVGVIGVGPVGPVGRVHGHKDDRFHEHYIGQIGQPHFHGAEEFGISLIYITHDLTTAYQLCETIIMMYRGTVVEAGSVDRVIKDPQHPYTQLLVDSIPLPNPKQKWGQLDFGARTLGDAGGSGRGCPFANRCPHVMNICREDVPPSYRTDPRRSVACFLYQDAPIARPNEVMALPPRVNAAAAVSERNGS